MKIVSLLVATAFGYMSGILSTSDSTIIQSTTLDFSPTSTTESSPTTSSFIPATIMPQSSSITTIVTSLSTTSPSISATIMPLSITSPSITIPSTSQTSIAERNVTSSTSYVAIPTANAIIQEDEVSSGALVSSIQHVADFLMYTSLVLSITSFIPVSLNLYSLGATSHLLMMMGFLLSVFTTNLVGLAYRYGHMQSITTILWLVTLVSLISRLLQIKLFGVFHQQVNLGYAYMLNLLFHLCTAGGLYVYGFISNTAEGATYLQIGGGLWIASIFLLEPVTLIYLACKLYNHLKTINWYNESYLKENRRKFTLIGLLLSAVSLFDICGILTFAYSFYDMAQVTLFRIVGYMIGIHIFSVLVFFEAIISMGFASQQSTRNSASIRNSLLK